MSKIISSVFDVLSYLCHRKEPIDAPKTVTFKSAYFQNAVKHTEVELTLVEGHTILASEFDKYADDTKVKLSFENTTDPYVSRNGWGIGGFANSDNWSPTYELKAADGKNFDIFVTVGDFKKLYLTFLYLPLPIPIKQSNPFCLHLTGIRRIAY